jgi:hypothetical protein
MTADDLIEGLCCNCGCRLVVPRWWILAGRRFCADCERRYCEAVGYADWLTAEWNRTHPDTGRDQSS